MAFRDEFEDIALVHLDAVYRGAFALCGRNDVAEDLVQTTFLKAFGRFESFKQGSKCKVWLMQRCMTLATTMGSMGIGQNIRKILTIWMGSKMGKR